LELRPKTVHEGGVMNDLEKQVMWQTPAPLHWRAYREWVGTIAALLFVRRRMPHGRCCDRSAIAGVVCVVAKVNA